MKKAADVPLYIHMHEGGHKVIYVKGRSLLYLRDKSKEKILLKLCTDIFPLNELSRNRKINTKKQHNF